MFYDLLGRVAVLYSSLKDAFNNRSNETLLKKQDPALLFLPATAGATQKVPNSYQESQAALLGEGGRAAQEQPQSCLKSHRIMWKVAWTGGRQSEAGSQGARVSPLSWCDLGQVPWAPRAEVSPPTK